MVEDLKVLRTRFTNYSYQTTYLRETAESTEIITARDDGRRHRSVQCVHDGFRIRLVPDFPRRRPLEFVELHAFAHTRNNARVRRCL